MSSSVPPDLLYLLLCVRLTYNPFYLHCLYRQRTHDTHVDFLASLHPTEHISNGNNPSIQKRTQNQKSLHKQQAPTP